MSPDFLGALLGGRLVVRSHIAVMGTCMARAILVGDERQTGEAIGIVV